MSLLIDDKTNILLSTFGRENLFYNVMYEKTLKIASTMSNDESKKIKESDSPSDIIKMIKSYKENFLDQKFPFDHYIDLGINAFLKLAKESGQEFHYRHAFQQALRFSNPQLKKDHIKEIIEQLSKIGNYRLIIDLVRFSNKDVEQMQKFQLIEHLSFEQHPLINEAFQFIDVQMSKEVVDDYFFGKVGYPPLRDFSQVIERSIEIITPKGVNSIEHIKVKIYLTEKIITHYLSANNYEKALEFARVVPERLLFASIFNQLKNNKLYEQALMVAKEFKYLNGLQFIAQDYMKLKKFEEAIDILISIKALNEKDPSDFFGYFMEEVYRTNDPQLYEKIAIKLDVYKHEKSNQHKVRLLAYAIQHHLQSGNNDKAIQLSEKAFNIEKIEENDDTQLNCMIDYIKSMLNQYRLVSNCRNS